MQRRDGPVLDDLISFVTVALPREGGSNADRRCNEKANKSSQQPPGNRRLRANHMIYLRKPSQFGNGDLKLAGVPAGMAILICHDRNAVTG